MDKLLQVPEYEQLCAMLSGDHNGKFGIIDIEVQHLSWLGAQVPEGGDVVEIGSHRGKSISAIGCGVRAAGNLGKVRMFAIDLWLKGEGKTYDHYNSQETWKIFNEQIISVGLIDHVQPKMTSSAKAAEKRGKPIHLLFIDASHKYKDVLQDFQLWSRFIPVGGYVAFHDYGTRFKGVDKVIKEVVIPSGMWGEDAVYGRIWSAKRIK
jgi:hypothetical protein